MGEMSSYSGDMRRCMLMKMAETSSGVCYAESIPPILSMAMDHLFAILLLLPVDALISLALTCKKLHSVATSDSLWEHICKRDWGFASVEYLKKFISVGRIDRSGLTWAKIYVLIAKLGSISCQKLLVEGSASDLPEPRASHSFNLLSGCLVLFGGGSSGGRHLDDIWVARINSMNKEALIWNRVQQAGTPSGRFGHTCVVIGDCLVLFGGINDRGNRHNDTWIGQLVKDETSGITFSWRLLNVGTITPPPRGAHGASFMDKKKMVIHGGIGINGSRLGDTWILDLSENLLFGNWWELTTPSPPPCSGHTLTRFKNSILLFGGRGSGYEVLNDVWILQSFEGELNWTRLPFDVQEVSFDLSRVGHSASVVIGERVLIFGGEDGVRNRKNDFWLLDANGFGCKPCGVREVDMVGFRPRTRSFHRACSDESGRYVFLFGGMVDGHLEPAETSALSFDAEFFVVDLFSLLPK